MQESFPPVYFSFDGARWLAWLGDPYHAMFNQRRNTVGSFNQHMLNLRPLVLHIKIFKLVTDDIQIVRQAFNCQLGGLIFPVSFNRDF